MEFKGGEGQGCIGLGVVQGRGQGVVGPGVVHSIE